MLTHLLIPHADCKLYWVVGNLIGYLLSTVSHQQRLVGLDLESLPSYRPQVVHVAVNVLRAKQNFGEVCLYRNEINKDNLTLWKYFLAIWDIELLKYGSFEFFFFWYFPW